MKALMREFLLSWLTVTAVIAAAMTFMIGALMLVERGYIALGLLMLCALIGLFATAFLFWIAGPDDES